MAVRCWACSAGPPTHKQSSDRELAGRTPKNFNIGKINPGRLNKNSLIHALLGFVHGDADQLIPSPAEHVSARVGQAPLACIVRLDTLSIVTEIKGYPTFARFMTNHIVGRLNQLMHFRHGHADLELGKLAVWSDRPDNFARVSAVNGFNDLGIRICCAGRRRSRRLTTSR